MSIESRSITVSGLAAEMVRKPIKNLQLGVYPPQGRVRVAMLGKLGWIKRQRAKWYLT